MLCLVTSLEQIFPIDIVTFYDILGVQTIELKPHTFFHCLAAKTGCAAVTLETKCKVIGKVDEHTHTRYSF